MPTIIIEVFIEKNSTINQEQIKELLSLRVGPADMAMLATKYNIVINSTKYKLLFTMSLKNVNMLIARQYEQKILTILSSYSVWLQWKNPLDIFQDGVWQKGTTNATLYKNREIVYSMDGCIITGNKIEDLDDSRKENQDLDNACLSRKTDVIEYVDYDNQVYLRSFDENGNTNYIMNGFVAKDIREEKKNYYLIAETVRRVRDKR